MGPKGLVERKERLLLTSETSSFPKGQKANATVVECCEALQLLTFRFASAKARDLIGERKFSFRTCESLYGVQGYIDLERYSGKIHDENPTF